MENLYVSTHFHEPQYVGDYTWTRNKYYRSDDFAKARIEDTVFYQGTKVYLPDKSFCFARKLLLPIRCSHTPSIDEVDKARAYEFGKRCIDADVEVTKQRFEWFLNYVRNPTTPAPDVASAKLMADIEYWVISSCERAAWEALHIAPTV